jgi:hypothetical protein
VLLLACGAAMAVADETTDATVRTQFGTERGAQLALTKIINEFDAAVPALTPEQQEYVNREETFRLGPGSVGAGGTYGDRVNAYSNSKEFRLWRAHSDLERLRANLAGVKHLAGRPERFALWSDIVVQMSFPSGLEVALRELRRMGVLDKLALGPAQGVSWLRGPSEGDVQLLWPFWAETMWASWCYEGIADATGASKSLVKHPR